MYLLRFCCSFEVKFWFPKFGAGPRGVLVSVTFKDRITKPLDVCYGFAVVFNFLITQIFGKGVIVWCRLWYRWVIRELVSSHRLSIQTTTLISGNVWPQFAMQVLTGGCQPQFGGKGWSYGVGDGSPK